MKKGALVLAVIAAMVVVYGCCSSQGGGNAGGMQGMGGGGSNPCNAHPGGSNDPHAAIICIDYATFDQAGVQPSPNPVSVSRTRAANFWFYNYGSANPTLVLTFTFPASPNCNGAHCVLTPADTTPLGQTKYTIRDSTSGREKDPDILIEPAP